MGKGQTARATQQIGQPGLRQRGRRGGGKQAARQQHAFDKWFDHQTPAQRLEHRGDAGGIKVHSARFGGEGCGNQPKIAQQSPVFIRESVVLGQKTPAALHIIAVGDKPFRQSLEQFLVFAEVEIHLQSPFRLSVYHRHRACHARQKVRGREKQGVGRLLALAGASVLSSPKKTA